MEVSTESGVLSPPLFVEESTESGEAVVSCGRHDLSCKLKVSTIPPSPVLIGCVRGVLIGCVRGVLRGV